MRRAFQINCSGNVQSLISNSSVSNMMCADFWYLFCLFYHPLAVEIISWGYIFPTVQKKTVLKNSNVGVVWHVAWRQTQSCLNVILTCMINWQGINTVGPPISSISCNPWFTPNYASTNPVMLVVVSLWSLWNIHGIWYQFYCARGCTIVYTTI